MTLERPRNPRSIQDRPWLRVFTESKDYTGRSRSMVQTDPVHVLTTVARLVAEAGSLRDIVPRLAVTLRTSIPFERLHVLRLDRAESFVLYVARETGAFEIREHRVGDPPSALDTS